MAILFKAINPLREGLDDDPRFRGKKVYSGWEALTHMLYKDRAEPRILGCIAVVTENGKTPKLAEKYTAVGVAHTDQCDCPMRGTPFTHYHGDVFVNGQLHHDVIIQKRLLEEEDERIEVLDRDYEGPFTPRFAESLISAS